MEIQVPSTQSSCPTTWSPKNSIITIDHSQPTKSRFCTRFRRGICTLSPSECKYAHGAKDLLYTKLDLNTLARPQEKEKPPKDPKEPKSKSPENVEGEAKDEEEEESENTESFVLIYDFQVECYNKGKVKELFTLEQLNSDINCLREIRKMYRASIAQEFFDLLCTVYETKYFKRWMVKYFFETIGWEARYVYLFRDNFATERKVKNEEYIIRLPQDQAFDDLVKDWIFQIVKNNNLLNSLPINPSIIRVNYYKEFMGKDPYMPDMSYYLKIKNYSRLDDYLKVLEKDEEFIRKLCDACGKNYEELKTQAIFDEESPAYLEFKKKIEEILLDLIKKSSFGFVMYSEYKTKVFQTLKKQIHEFSKSDTQVERLMHEFAFKNKIVILSLHSDIYLFSLKKIQDTKLVNLRKEVPKALHQSCFESKENVYSGHSPYNFHHKFSDDEHIYDKIDDEILNKELDLSKVHLVNSVESLEEAKFFFKDATDVAIDLEGNLRKGGTIELLQCGLKNKIVIFDLWDINSKAAKSENPDSVESQLAKDAVSFIKSFVEDVKICKVFHDCRGDSTALHLFTGSCPNNVMDVSAVYMLIEQLKTYQQYSGVLGLPKVKVEESKNEVKDSKASMSLNSEAIVAISEEIAKFWPPGLNDVLSRYEASNGPNGLKHIFKERFDKMNKDYFFKRPIDKEFLIYSARDVEDLVEVKDKMIKTVFSQLSAMGVNGLDEEKVNYVCLAASRTYSIFGCDHKKD